MKPIKLLLMGTALALTVSCTRFKSPCRLPHAPAHAIYYWKTVFAPDTAETNFIRRHHIERMYIRFFDVVAEDFYLTDGKKRIIPNATIQFNDTIPMPVKEVIPTVYITLDALKEMKDNEGDAAGKIVCRVLNICSYHTLRGVNELQLDCDWTTSTQDIYFTLCQAVADTLKAQTQRPFLLSSTIRLHQLSQEAPPVDYGVLMVYNTGSFKNPRTRNSILDYDDVLPYLRKPIHYALPLDIAYPTYEWTLWFRNKQFKGLLTSDERPTDTFPGDSFRKETSDFATISHVQQLVQQQVLHHTQEHSNILYQLDAKNLKKYTDHEIDSIYSYRLPR